MPIKKQGIRDDARRHHQGKTVGMQRSNLAERPCAQVAQMEEQIARHLLTYAYAMAIYGTGRARELLSGSNPAGHYDARCFGLNPGSCLLAEASALLSRLGPRALTPCAMRTRDRLRNHCPV